MVFGRDKGGKPHASSFTASEADLATKAAELMGLRLLPIRTDTERALAAQGAPRAGVRDRAGLRAVHQGDPAHRAASGGPEQRGQAPQAPDRPGRDRGR